MADTYNKDYAIKIAINVNNTLHKLPALKTSMLAVEQCLEWLPSTRPLHPSSLHYTVSLLIAHQ
jgi:hypothetical protein